VGDYCQSGTERSQALIDPLVKSASNCFPLRVPLLHVPSLSTHSASNNPDAVTISGFSNTIPLWPLPTRFPAFLVVAMSYGGATCANPFFLFYFRYQQRRHEDFDARVNRPGVRVAVRQRVLTGTVGADCRFNVVDLTAFILPAYQSLNSVVFVTVRPTTPLAYRICGRIERKLVSGIWIVGARSTTPLESSKVGILI
jgi:hypothetical protein